MGSFPPPEIGNTFSTTTIAALTTNTRHSRMPTHVSISGSNEPLRDSVAMLEQLRTIDKSRLKSYVGKLSEMTMKKIDSALSISVGANLHRNEETR